jgi:hypothetical protein
MKWAHQDRPCLVYFVSETPGLSVPGVLFAKNYRILFFLDQNESRTSGKSFSSIKMKQEL